MNSTEFFGQGTAIFPSSTEGQLLLRDTAGRSASKQIETDISFDGYFIKHI